MVRLLYTSCGSVRKRGLILPPPRVLAAPAFRWWLVRPAAEPDSESDSDSLREFKRRVLR
jgi:hypothetical protein